MKDKLNYIFTSILIVAIVVGLFKTRDWNAITALFPRVVGVPALGLSVAILLTSIRKGRQPVSEQSSRADAEFARTFTTAIILMSWIVGFIILMWVVGINIAIPVYVFAYLKVQGKYGWLWSSIAAICTGLFVFLVFNVTFRIVWPEGVIQGFF